MSLWSFIAFLCIFKLSLGWLISRLPGVVSMTTRFYIDLGEDRNFLLLAMK